jgi:predicted site-specific integrase-resolvase
MSNLITTKEMLDILGISRTTAYTYARLGRLQVYRQKGNKNYYDEQEVLNLKHELELRTASQETKYINKVAISDEYLEKHVRKPVQKMLDKLSKEYPGTKFTIGKITTSDRNK